jgi:hypothetical protein
LRQRQSPERFGAGGLRLHRRIGVEVGQAVVDRRHACAAQIPEPCDLDRRRLEKKQRQAVVGRMAVQIDQNVDRVVANAPGGLASGISDRGQNGRPTRQAGGDIVAAGIT